MGLLQLRVSESSIKPFSFCYFMRLIQKGLKSSWDAARRNAVLLVSTVVLQLVLMVVLVFLLQSFQMTFLEDMQYVLLPLENIDYNPESVTDSSSFIEEVHTVYKSIQLFKEHLLSFALQLSVILVVFNGFLWVASHALLRKKKLALYLKMWLNYVLLSVIFMALIFIVANLLMRNLLAFDVTTDLISNYFYFFAVFFAVFYYLLLIGLAFLDQSFSKILSAVYGIGIKRFFHSAGIFLIVFGTILLNLWLIHFSISSQKLFSLVIPSTVLLGVVLVVTRIFWITVINEKNNH